MRVLYIDIDSLRPSHLGCYGYHRKTSPNIDALAERGVRLENLYATDTPCLPSRTAFFTGRHGALTGVVNHGGVCADLAPQGKTRDFRSRMSESTLGSFLSRIGYRTISISPFPRRHSAYQVTHGFHETFDTGKGGLENADEIEPVVLDWLERRGEEDNWFLHVNFWDPHTPYDTPESFGNPFEREAIDGWLTQEILDEQWESFGPHSAREVPGISDELPGIWRWGRGAIRNLEDAKVHIDGYDAGVLYADMAIGRIVDKLEELGVLDETAIVVSADHGENLGELNVWGDHQTADDFTNHIPGVVVWPGVTDEFAGSSRSEFLYGMDLSAMFVNLLAEDGAQAQVGLEEAGWQGRGDLASALVSGGDGGREEVYLSQGAWSCQRAKRWGDWIYLWTRHTGMKNFEADMLFNLKDDPHQTRNLVSEKVGLVSEARRDVEEWFGGWNEMCPYGDPFDIVVEEGGPLHARVFSGEGRRYLERLRATGRGHHADWLEKTNSLVR